MFCAIALTLRAGLVPWQFSVHGLTPVASVVSPLSGWFRLNTDGLFGASFLGCPVSHQFKKEGSGVLVDLDALTAATIAARAPHRGVQWCLSLGVLCVQLGAMIGKELNRLGPSPESRTMERRLQEKYGLTPA